MKAAILSSLGSLQNLNIASNVKILETRHNEALIKIDYCGVNHLDLLIIQKLRSGPKTFPHILGSEFVGTISQIKADNEKFKVGDQVAVYPWTFCGKCPQCTKGKENICDYGGTFGRTCWGGYAEYAVVPVQNLIKIAKELPLDKVCALSLAATTAYHLIQRAQIKDKSTVLVTGASGGVGTFVIQLLKNKKSTIICSTSHNNKKDFLLSLGADYIISTTKLISEVKQIYPSGVDYVIDIMGGKVWSESVEVLAKNGTIVFCATTLFDSGVVDIGSVFSRQINILGSYGGTINDLKSVITLLEKGIIHPVIDSIYPLDKTKDALKKLSEQKVFGKILIEVTK